MTELAQSIFLASAGIFSVGSIAITLLLLLSQDGRLKGLAYMLGYVLSYSLIGIGLIVLGGAFRQGENEGSGSGFSIVSLVFGLLLVFLGIKNWIKARKKENKDARESFSFLKYFDKISWLKAFAGGFLVSIINAKNLMLFMASITIVYLSSYSFYFKIINVLLVTLVFCSTVILPVVISFLFPQKATKILELVKQFLEANRAVIGIVVPLVFGLFFVFKGFIKLL